MSSTQRAPARKVWTARVVADARRRPREAAPPVPEHIRDLARQAARSAQESARQAARAAHAASLAEVAAGRLATDVHQARSTALDIARSAAAAAEAATEARSRADLAGVAADLDPPRREPTIHRDHRPPTDSASLRG